MFIHDSLTTICNDYRKCSSLRFSINYEEMFHNGILAGSNLEACNGVLPGAKGLHVTYTTKFHCIHNIFGYLHLTNPPPTHTLNILRLPM